ncbi:hypothetical protein MASR1M32_39410 [Rhodobacter sp.]
MRPSGHGKVGRKDEAAEAQGGIGADLGHHGEKGGDDAGGGGIGSGQPELQRHQRALEGKDQHQKDCGHPHQGLVPGGKGGKLCGKVGHVQRAGDGIDRSQRKEEQSGADQVDGDVLQPGAQARAGAAMDHQPIGRDQEHLEEHEEVEGVAGQERSVQAHQLEKPERVEPGPALIPAGGDGLDQGDQRQPGGQQQHQAGQPVEDEGNAEWRGPVAQPVDLRACHRCGLDQRDGDHQQRRRARHREKARAARAEEQRQCRKHGGQHDRGDDPVSHRHP